MKKLYETQHLLKSIKADDLGNIYNHVTHKAVEWAVGGQLHYANGLLENVWAFYSADYRNVRRELEGLQIMWELSGNFPSGIPFPFRKVEEIEEENWIDIRIVSPFKGEDVYAILSQLETSIQKADGYNYGTLSAGAAILALENGLIPEGKKFIQDWGEGYMKDYHYMVSHLMRNRKTSTLLLQGLLLPVFNLTAEKCRAEYEELSAALKERKEGGRKLMYGDQSWNSLLKNLSLLAIKDDPELFAEDLILSKWLGSDPASEASILAAEERIGKKLPADYREFLKASNGFPRHSNTSPSLLPVEEIGWLSDLDNGLAELVEQMLEWGGEKYAGLSKDCLLVSGLNEEEQILLFPTKEGNWECWYLVIPGGCGETWYPGFRYCMEDRLFFLEWVS